MDSIKELFDVIKGRISSPLFGSFVLFWFIFNWEIPTILFFYKQNEYKIDGKGASFIDAINRQINVWDNFFIPLTLAIFYVLVYPWIKAKIDEYNINISTGSEARIIKTTNARSMPMSKYFSKLKTLDDREKELELIGIEQSDLNSRIRELETNLEKSNKSLREKFAEYQILENKISNYQKANSKNYLDGVWSVKNDMSPPTDSDVWTFKDGMVYNNSKKPSFIIQAINGDPESKTTFLHLKGVSGPNLILPLLQIDSRAEHLQGRDTAGDLYEFVKMGSLPADFQ